MTDAPFWSDNPTLDLAAYRFGSKEAMKRYIECLSDGNMEAARKHLDRATWYADRAIQLEQQLAGEDENDQERG